MNRSAGTGGGMDNNLANFKRMTRRDLGLLVRRVVNESGGENEDQQPRALPGLDRPLKHLSLKPGGGADQLCNLGKAFERQMSALGVGHGAGGRINLHQRDHGPGSF